MIIKIKKFLEDKKWYHDSSYYGSNIYYHERFIKVFEHDGSFKNIVEIFCQQYTNSETVNIKIAESCFVDGKITVSCGRTSPYVLFDGFIKTMEEFETILKCSINWKDNNK